MTIDSKCESLATEWLAGMVLVAFEHSAGFRLRFERNEIRSDLPQVLYLEIKATAWIGSRGNWQEFIDVLPLEERRGEPNDPALAYRFMLLIGASVSSVDISQNSTLCILTSDQEAIFISGNDDVWDESWILTEPAELDRKSVRAITCDNGGMITAV